MEQAKNHTKIEAESFNLQQYLDRIRFSEKIEGNIEGIKKLMQSHIFSIPFENIDVQAGKIISLNGDDIVNKIITEKRGGYCYQINGLFSLALQQIGIAHYYVAARPMVNPGQNPKTHLALIVEIENEEYLIDMGFGGNSIREPLKLNETGKPIQQGYDNFTLSKNETNEYVLQILIGSDWSNLYSFALIPQDWIDFKPANHYNYSHPDSFFVKNLIVVLQNASGKKILLNNSVKSVTNGKSEVVSFEDHELKNIFESEFDLKI